MYLFKHGLVVPVLITDKKFNIVKKGLLRIATGISSHFQIFCESGHLSKFSVITYP